MLQQTAFDRTAQEVDRLTEEEIAGVLEGLEALDAESWLTCGLTIGEIAREAAGFAGTEPALSVAVVPVTAGCGLIGGFAQTLAGILAHLGARAFVTQQSDIAGVEEAYRGGAQVVFAADDYTFSAFGTCAAALSDNQEATGRAFACALTHMASGNDALVLGAGPVGSSATRYLTARGYTVSVFDLDTAKAARLAARTGARLERRADCTRFYRNILDATNAGGFIDVGDVTLGANLAAPGIPLCVSPAAARQVNLFHNPLELGVATMYYDCARQLQEDEQHG